MSSLLARKGQRPLRPIRGLWRAKDCSVDSQLQFGVGTREPGERRVCRSCSAVSISTPGSLQLPSLGLTVFLQEEKSSLGSFPASPAVAFCLFLSPRTLNCLYCA